MSFPPVPEATLLHILSALQEGEISKRHAMGCIASALGGTFNMQMLPDPIGYFDMDEVPMKVVQELRANAAPRRGRPAGLVTIRK